MAAAACASLIAVSSSMMASASTQAIANRDHPQHRYWVRQRAHNQDAEDDATQAAGIE